MKDLFIIAATGAVFVFGWFLTGKFCVLLKAGRQSQDSLLTAGETSLRIGFFDPLAADSILHVLEEYSAAHPNVSISLFSGTEAELTEGLSSQKLDVAFLPVNTAVPEKACYRVVEIPLKHAPVRMQFGGLLIRPMTEGPVEQKLLWRETGIAPVAGSFVHCLKNDMKRNRNQRKIVI